MDSLKNYIIIYNFVTCYLMASRLKYKIEPPIINETVRCVYKRGGRVIEICISKFIE